MQKNLGPGWIIAVIVLAVAVIAGVFIFANKPAIQVKPNPAQALGEKMPEQPVIPKAQ